MVHFSLLILQDESPINPQEGRRKALWMPTMAFLASVVILCVVLTAAGARAAHGEDPGVFNVLNYGAKGDDQSDDSDAFLKAWEAACKGDEAGQTPTLVVPAGKSFLLRPLHFRGPCKSATIKFQVLGSITAPTRIEEWQNCDTGSWISFSEIANLTVDGSGSGVINGRGHIWWSGAKSRLIPYGSSSSCQRPKALSFVRMENLELSGLTHLDSPRAHIRIEKCNSTKLSTLRIIAPEHSPNTDGVAVATSSHVQIHDSTIGTGDDCISLKGGSSFINITGVKCGPGHGISVGSLGKDGAYDTVEEVTVRNCSFSSTQNGARIKTWQGGSGYVKGILFEDINVSYAHNPIIIDQSYAAIPKRSGKAGSSAVKVSGVTFRNVTGISGSEPSITLRCAKGTDCTGIEIDNVNLSSEPGKKSYADCENVVDANFTSVSPPVSCHNS